jgi:hypothetical protein
VSITTSECKSVATDKEIVEFVLKYSAFLWKVSTTLKSRDREREKAP